MTADELRALLRAGPGEQNDLLPDGTPARRLIETLAAFANTAGGTLVLGATRDGAPAGLADPAASRQQLIELALQSEPPLLMPVPSLQELDGAPLLIVHVPAGLPHVYGVGGRFLRRRGAHNEPITGPAMRELILARMGSYFESEPLLNAGMGDLDRTRIERYARAVAYAAGDSQQLLLARGCLVEVEGRLHPTVAGMLLFGRQPCRFVPSAAILAIRYPGREMSDEFVKEEIDGPLSEQIVRAAAFVESMEARSSRLAGTRRDEYASYPPAAVREAIVNAVAHRDYRQRGDTIRLLIYSDRIECYSPGRLPGHVTLANLVDERFSRNEVLVQVLSDLGFIERLGYGIDRMIRLMQEWNLPAPHFEETAAGFRVTLYGPAGIGMAAALPRDRGQWVHLGLNPRQEEAIRFLEENGRISNRDLQGLYPDVSDETVRRDLADLVNKGLLLKIGEKRATFYILK